MKTGAQVVTFLSILLLVGCKKQDEKTSNLMIATSANMQFALKDIVKAFTKETNIECELVVGSSGKLTAQIREGAPFDVLVSADMKYPVEVQKSGLAQSEPKVYAYGTLILWTMFNTINPSLSILEADSIQHIAIANPKIAPYGFAASQVLENYGVLAKVDSKLVYGESIAQANQFIASKSAEIGFTSSSSVLSQNLSEQGKWIAIPKDMYAPITQGVVVLKKRNKVPNQALEFEQFLFSKTAQNILIQYGYDIPN